MSGAVASPAKLLFVCSRNRRRSLTAERLFDGATSCEARSAGTQPGARVALTPGLIGWADIIFFMERSHLNRARERFAEELDGKTAHVLHIPDDYEFMQPELLDELRAKLEDWITFSDGSTPAE
jgi:predicted protein tyrosine phosphatase